MRPAYETFIEAIKKDLNRVASHEWDRSCQQLFDVATKEERRYLKQELKKLKYEYAEVVLGKLILGVRDEADDKHLLDAYGLTRGRSAARVTPIVGEFDEDGNLMSKPNPNQLELDL